MPPSTTRPGSAAFAFPLAPYGIRSVFMATNSYSAYLFSWVPNSEQWDWDDLRSFRKNWLKNPNITEDWSCGRSKSVPINARIYLIKQGDLPRGIFGAGRTSSRSQQRYDGYYNDLSFDTFLDPEQDGVLPVERLHDLSKTIWHNQMSGVGLVPEIAQALERRWQTFLKRLRVKPRRIPLRLSDSQDMSLSKEGRRRLAKHFVRERDPAIVRKKKQLVFAESGCLECEVCGFDFCESYGDLGGGICDCHHQIAISDGERTTRLEDLHIVCPNCHRILHGQYPMLTIRQLRTVVQRKRS